MVVLLGLPRDRLLHLQVDLRDLVLAHGPLQHDVGSVAGEVLGLVHLLELVELVLLVLDVRLLLPQAEVDLCEHLRPGQLVPPLQVRGRLLRRVLRHTQRQGLRLYRDRRVGLGLRQACPGRGEVVARALEFDVESGGIDLEDRVALLYRRRVRRRRDDGEPALIRVGAQPDFRRLGGRERAGGLDLQREFPLGHGVRLRRRRRHAGRRWRLRLRSSERLCRPN